MRCILCGQEKSSGRQTKIGWTCNDCFNEFRQAVTSLHPSGESNRQRAELGAIFHGDMTPANVSHWDFSGPNSLIFRRMQDLEARGETIDRVTVANELMKNNELEEVGGLTYIVALCDE